jgi:hypothetical protein
VANAMNRSATALALSNRLAVHRQRHQRGRRQEDGAAAALEADVPDQAVAHVQVHGAADAVERVDDLRTMSGKGRNGVAESCGRGRMTDATGG